MELKDTVEGMCSPDYRKRMSAEYQQLRIRYYNLKAICTRMEAAALTGTAEPETDCPLSLLKKQLRYMGQYMHALEVRASIEGVDL